MKQEGRREREKIRRKTGGQEREMRKERYRRTEGRREAKEERREGGRERRRKVPV